MMVSMFSRSGGRSLLGLCRGFRGVRAACPVGYFDTLFAPEMFQKGRRAEGRKDARFGGGRRSRRRQ